MEELLHVILTWKVDWGILLEVKVYQYMMIIDIVTEYISLLPIICLIYVTLFVIIMSLSVWRNVQLTGSNLEEEHNSCYEMLLKLW